MKPLSRSPPAHCFPTCRYTVQYSGGICSTDRVRLLLCRVPHHHRHRVLGSLQSNKTQAEFLQFLHLGQRPLYVHPPGVVTAGMPPNLLPVHPNLQHRSYRIRGSPCPSSEMSGLL